MTPPIGKAGGECETACYKLTREYAQRLRDLGFSVIRRRGSLMTTFPPLTVVIARKPQQPR